MYTDKTCPNATWSTKNPTWTSFESNPGCRGERLQGRRIGQKAYATSNVLRYVGKK
jgi:hypothetical protein